MIPMINDGYKPTFEGNALSAYFNGLNAANADNSAQEEILRQYLANQRELQIAPLDIGIKQWEAASAQDKLNDPEYRKWALQGYTGQMKTQDAAGKKAQQNWKGDANLVDTQNKNKLTRERVLAELYDLKNKGEGGTIGFPMQAQQGLDLPTPPVFGNMRTESSLKNVMQNQPGEGMGAPRDTSYDRVELTRALANPKLSPENRKALEAELARLNAGTLGTGMDAPPPLGSVPPNVAGVTQQQVATNDSPLVQQPPRRNWGISPGSSRAEQLMSILVDTPELRTDLIKGDQKADSAEYMKMLDYYAKLFATEQAARARAGASGRDPYIEFNKLDPRKRVGVIEWALSQGINPVTRQPLQPSEKEAFENIYKQDVRVLDAPTEPKAGSVDLGKATEGKVPVNPPKSVGKGQQKPNTYDLNGQTVTVIKPKTE